MLTKVLRVRLGKRKHLKPKAFFHGYAVGDDRKQEAELYDLEADLGEQNNLAKTHPQKVAELHELMRSIEGQGKPVPDCIR